MLNRRLENYDGNRLPRSLHLQMLLTQKALNQHASKMNIPLFGTKMLQNYLATLVLCLTTSKRSVKIVFI